MGFLDNFKGKQYKQEKENLQNELNRIKATFTPEMHDAAKLQEFTNSLKSQIDNLNSIINQKNIEIQNLNNRIVGLNNAINYKQSELVIIDEEIELQSFGLYQPKYDFASSEIYKQKLTEIRNQQKDLIKSGQAVTGNMNWTVNGNKSQGKKMVKDMQKLLLRAFNSECDELIDKVKYNTFDTAEKRMKNHMMPYQNLAIL